MVVQKWYRWLWTESAYPCRQSRCGLYSCSQNGDGSGAPAPPVRVGFVRGRQEGAGRGRRVARARGEGGGRRAGRGDAPPLLLGAEGAQMLAQALPQPRLDGPLVEQRPDGPPVDGR